MKENQVLSARKIKKHFNLTDKTTVKGFPIYTSKDNNYVTFLADGQYYSKIYKNGEVFL